MAEAVTRLGEGKWIIIHNGKKYTRKIHREVKNRIIKQWIIIGRKKIYLKSVRVG